MERRTFESHMEWEYQNQGPMDPTSPFVHSIKNGNKSNTAFGASTEPPESSAQPSPLTRTQSTPSKPLANTPNLAPRSIFAYPSSQNPIQRTNTAPPFRNPAFTTPRKFDLDTLSEASPAESTPDVTDISGLTDTPELDSCRSLRHVNLSPIRNRALVNSMRRSPGKGDIGRPMFGSRDKVRKRKRRADDKDISGFRLPYRHSDEWDESDSPDSDDSTFQPNEHQRRRADRVNSTGWFGGFLATIQKHPTAPHILGYWLNLLFNTAVLGVVAYMLWWVIQGFRSELDMTHMSERSALYDAMAKCAKEYADNRCAPPDARLPGLRAMCEEWETCMHQDPDEKYPLRSGAKNIVEIFNNIFEAMHWKTMVAFFFLVLITCTSGVTLFKSSPPPSFPPAAPLAPQPSQHHYAYGQNPRTPHRKAYAYLRNDDTPDTDASMDDSSLLLSAPYDTPARWRSPIKDHRTRSPTKSRSPSKRY